MKQIMYIGVLGLFLMGCESDTTLDKVPTKMWISPILNDMGTVYVGQEKPVLVNVESLQGEDLEIYTFTVTNVMGEYFSYDGDTEFIVPVKETVVQELTYLPLEPGYHQCDILVESNSIEGSITVGARAQAIFPTVTRWPDLLDFGEVPVDGSHSRELTIQNDNTIDVTISEVNFTDDQFALQDALPLTIAAGAQTVITVDVHANTLDTIVAEMSFVFVEEVILEAVSLHLNDCANGEIAFYDQDGDGFTSCGGDCNDNDLNINPTMQDVCDGIDNNCDGVIDENTPCHDDDGDGYSEDEGDCNDNDVTVSPGVEEIDDNGVDDDCDGIIDISMSDVDLDGYTTEGGDCDDNDYTVFPGAPETADGIDNDCDGTVDEGTVNYDDDNDGYSEADGDCNDLVATTYPTAPELPDWQDNDCDGTVDEGTVNYDDDGDGYTEVGGDTDDTDPNIHP